MQVDKNKIYTSKMIPHHRLNQLLWKSKSKTYGNTNDNDTFDAMICPSKWESEKQQHQSVVFVDNSLTIWLLVLLECIKLAPSQQSKPTSWILSLTVTENIQNLKYCDDISKEHANVILLLLFSGRMRLE